jgi:hypothetical protein
MPVVGIDQDADDVNNGAGADPDDIAAWMAQRQQDVANRDQNVAAGQGAWAASTATGDNLEAPNPDDVRALGADAQGQDAAATSRAPLTPSQVSAIVWNESRSLSGPQVQQMREQIAHTVMNADAKWGDKRSTYARTSSTTANVPPAEKGTYDSSAQAVQAAIAQRARGVDPTNGAVFYQFLPGGSPPTWQDRSMKVQQGPFNNSYPHGKLGRSNVHWYAY